MQEKTAIKFPSKRKASEMGYTPPKTSSDAPTASTFRQFATDYTACLEDKSNRLPQEKSSFAPVLKADKVKSRKHSSESSKNATAPSSTAKFQNENAALSMVPGARAATIEAQRSAKAASKYRAKAKKATKKVAHSLKRAETFQSHSKATITKAFN